MSGINYFRSPWYSTFVSQYFSPASFLRQPLLPFRGETRRWEGVATAKSRLEKAYPGWRGLCIESIRADLNRWLPLTFTGGPFPINLQGPPPLEEWLQPLPPPPPTPNRLIHVSDQGGCPISLPDGGKEKKEIHRKRISSLFVGIFWNCCFW